MHARVVRVLAEEHYPGRRHLVKLLVLLLSVKIACGESHTVKVSVEGLG